MLSYEGLPTGWIYTTIQWQGQTFPKEYICTALHGICFFNIIFRIKNIVLINHRTCILIKYSTIVWLGTVINKKTPTKWKKIAQRRNVVTCTFDVPIFQCVYAGVGTKQKPSRGGLYFCIVCPYLAVSAWIGIGCAHQKSQGICCAEHNLKGVDKTKCLNHEHTT